MPRWIIHGLRVALHIGIRIEPQHVPLNAIDRQEHAHQWIIIPGDVIVQSGKRVMHLAGIASGGGDTALQVATTAVGTAHLLTQDRAGAEREQHAAQGIGQGEGGVRAIGRADEVAGQIVGVDLAGQGAVAGVVVFLQTEKVDRKRGARGVRVGEDTVAAGIVEVTLQVATDRVVLVQVVERIVMERGGQAVVGPAGFVAPGIVAEAGNRRGAALVGPADRRRSIRTTACLN